MRDAHQLDAKITGDIEFVRSYEFEIKSSGIVRWSEPLIADRISYVYDYCLHNHEASKAIKSEHCWMWRYLLEGRTSLAKRARRQLLELTTRANLEETALEQIDKSVMDDLFCTILRRWRAPSNESRLNGMALMMAASTLGEIRNGAEPQGAQIELGGTGKASPN
jgi:hypothetical protein